MGPLRSEWCWDVNLRLATPPAPSEIQQHDAQPKDLTEALM